MPQISSVAVEMQRGDRASLLMRVRSIDPRRPCVKDHATLTLKADNVGQKYEWIARMNKAHGGAAAAPAAAVAPQPQQQAGAPPPAGSAATSAAPTPRTSQGGGPPLGPGAPGQTISIEGGEWRVVRQLSCLAGVLGVLKHVPEAHMMHVSCTYASEDCS
jgi:hypothetical protein